MHPTSERHYIVTSSLIGWVHAQNDPCVTNEVAQNRPCTLASIKIGSYMHGAEVDGSVLKIGFNIYHINGLVQERRNSIANALELRLSCTYPSIWCICTCTVTERRRNKKGLLHNKWAQNPIFCICFQTTWNIQKFSHGPVDVQCYLSSGSCKKNSDLHTLQRLRQVNLGDGTGGSSHSLDKWPKKLMSSPALISLL